jgi:hypothetical protein
MMACMGACSRREVPGPLTVPTTHPSTDRFPDSRERTGRVLNLTGAAGIALVGETTPGEFLNGTTNMERWRCTVPVAGISGNSTQAMAGG